MSEQTLENLGLVEKQFALLKNSTLLMGAAAVANVYSVMQLLSLPLNTSVWIAPLLMIGVYGLNHLADDEEDSVNQTSGDIVRQNWQHIILGVGIGAYLIGVGMSVLYGDLVVGALSTIPLLSLLIYSFPVIWIGNASRIKELFVINSMLVAFAWAVTVVVLPITLSPEPTPRRLTALVFVFIFLRWYMSVEAANTPDIDGDTTAGISTIPTRYGLSGTRKLLYIFELFSVIVIGSIAIISSTPVFALLLLFVVGYTLICTHTLIQGGRLRYVSTAWDASFILMGILLFISDYIFV